MNVRSAARCWLCALSCVLLALVARDAHGQLTVDALEVHMTASSGVRMVNVRNDAAKRVQAVLTIEDWERDERGVNRFMSGGSHPSSCAGALEVFPKSIVLEPGESANVRLSLTQGAGASPGAAANTANCWSVVFIENRATQESGGRQLSYNVRTGIKVFGESATARRDGFIEAMEIAESSTDSLDVMFRNAGDVQLLVKASVEVRRVDNSVVHRAELESFPVLPSQRRMLRSAVPVLPKGRYVLLALLDYGGSEIVAGQLEYEVR